MARQERPKLTYPLDDVRPTPDVIVGKSREQLAVVTYVDAYYWRCQVCGWLGTQLMSVELAIKEAGQHWDRDHPDLRRREIEVQRHDV